MSFTPLELSIILHYHSSAEDMPWVLGEVVIGDATMSGLVLRGLLTGIHPVSEKMRYRPTPMLHAFVKLLEETPLPVESWIDPRTGSVLGEQRCGRGQSS